MQLNFFQASAGAARVGPAQQFRLLAVSLQVRYTVVAFVTHS